MADQTYNAAPPPPVYNASPADGYNPSAYQQPPQGGYNAAPYPAGQGYADMPKQGIAVPAQGYAQVPPQGPQPIYIQAPMMMPAVVRFGEVPQPHTCQFCHQPGLTVCSRKNGSMVWLAMGGLILLGCWLGCCFIPLCIDSLKDVEHHCPNCGNIVGIKPRME